MKINLRKIAFLSFLALAGNSIQAQTQKLGNPKSYSDKISSVKSGFLLPEINNQAELEYYNNEAAASGLKLMQYGKAIETNINVFEQAKKTSLPNGDNLYQFMVESSNAVSLNLIFSQFHLKEGTLMYVFSADKSSFIGAYTSLNNNVSNELGTELLYSNKIIVEIQEPKLNENQSQLTIGKVIHGFINLDDHIEKSLNSSGDCNIDVSCPQGSGWEIPRNGVAMMVNGTGGFCTGSMVNNTSGVLIPYFLTANHCGSNPGSWVFRFRWESPVGQFDCGTNVASGNGPENMNVNGGVTRASYSPSDFHLIELNTAPNVAWNVNYNGWNRLDVPPTSGAGIHHPDGDIKKIAVTTTPYTTSSFGGSPMNHWHAVWSEGVTEGGSSGSPLFDQNRRIVGQLHGGASGCFSSDQSDEYGKFSASWIGGGTASSRLSDWLDPQNTGVDFIDADVTNSLDPFFAGNVIGIENTICSGDIQPKVILTNGGSNLMTTATINYSLNGTDYVFDWTGSLGLYESDTVTLNSVTLASGNYTLIVEVLNPNGTIDENMNNNVLTKTFNTIVGGVDLVLTLNLDCYSSETSWEIVDQNSVSLFQGGSYSETFPVTNSTINRNVCLVEGQCYDFFIRDTYGDGMTSNANNCEDGSYYLNNSNNDTLVQLLQSEANFLFENVKNFCVGSSNLIDAALINSVLGIENFICTSTIQPEIILLNSGNVDLTSATINFNLDGTDYTFNWSGNIPYGESDTVTLQSIAVSGSTHLFTATVNNPNGNVDGNLTNNDVTKSFSSIVGGTNLVLSMNLDCFAVQTSWEIVDQNSTSLFQSPVYDSQATLYTMTHNVCLNNGCYDFKIYDSNNDGLTSATCDSGSYSLNLQNNTVVVQLTQAESSFGNSNTKNFCIGNTGLADLTSENQVSIYPNPSATEFNITSKQEILEIEILDLAGKLIVSKANIHSVNYKTDSNLNNGIYLVKIKTENGTSIHKIVKK